MKYKVLILLLCFLLIGCGQNKTYELSSEYYQKDNLIEITKEELQKLENDEKSFSVFLYQPFCSASNELEETVTTFLKEHQISFYKIAYTNIDETLLGDTVKYYPSVIIYEKGKIIKYLRADCNEDMCCYENAYNFENWFTETIPLE